MTHFNQVANDWDSPMKTKMMQTLAQGVRENIDLSKKYRIMDFGTGTGLFGLELLDHASFLLGVDTSEGMLEVFNKKVAMLDYVKSLNINLENEDFDGDKFDLIISSMAFHHLNDPELMIQKMKKYINNVGKIIVVDLDQEDGTFHPNNKEMGVKHFGFSKETLENWAKSAELKISNYQIIHSIVKNDRNYEIFMCEFSH